MAWDRRVLDHNPETGVTQFHNYDPDTDNLVLETVQDVEAITEVNRNLHRLVDENAKFGGDGLGPRVASIPMVIYMDLKKRGILDDQKALKRWLNDPDNRHFRTRPGRI